ncbi:hypothetical protein GDO78_020245, partial [Eleutherodactylus coqui]
MAACGRVRLWCGLAVSAALALLVCPAVGAEGAAPEAADKAVAAQPAASQPRRLPGIRLIEEEACREDISRICPKNSWNNNLAVLECLQDVRE